METGLLETGLKDLTQLHNWPGKLTSFSPAYFSPGDFVSDCEQNIDLYN